MSLKTFKELVVFLEGKKSFIIGLLIIGLTISYALGYIPKSKMLEVITLLNGTAILTLRSAIKKSTSSK